MSKKWETSYHFYCFKSRVVLHGHNAGNGGVRGAIQKSCCKKSIEIVVYLDRDPLSSQK